MMNTNLSKHCIVLNLRLPQRWAVVGNQYQFTCHEFSPNSLKQILQTTLNIVCYNNRDLKQTFGIPERLEHSFVTKSVFTTLHHKSQPVVGALMSLLLQFFQFLIESNSIITR